MDTVAHLQSSLASRYQIEREIGRGGMATVYLARDVRHARNVAVKVLNPELGAVLGVERFLSEIQVTANMQHPHLLPLFDSGEAEGLLFYVMPYIQGESLRSRLRKEKQLPIDEAVRLATAVGSALDYAHRHGVIHRDLKPENILLHDGQPLVADFGIALAVSAAGGERITQTGISLGTPHYMSPEQATGDRVVDQRSDVYSLGAVLYEMLTGDPPHTASTAQGVIAKVLTDHVRSTRLTRPNVPTHVDAATMRALEKLPADRWMSAHDFCEALNGRAPVTAPASTRTPAHPARLFGAVRRAAGSPWPWAAGFMVATAAASWLFAERQAQADFPIQFTVAMPQDERLHFGSGSGRILAIAPDGRTLAFVSAGGGRPRRIYVRVINDLAPRLLAGTEGARHIDFSEDGSEIAFVADQQLKRVSVAGGTVTVLAELPQSFGIDWGPADQIVMSTGDKLALLSSSGGASRALTSIDSATVATVRWPRMLPDGRTVIYTRWTGGLSSAQLYGLRTDDSLTRPLNINGTSAIGMMDGHLLYATATSAIFAVPFDVGTLRVTGNPILVLDRAALTGTGAEVADISRSGSLIYQSGSSLGFLTLVDSAGAVRRTLGDARAFTQPRFSPDGRHIAVSVGAQTSTDVHIHTVATGTLTRLTTEGVVNDRPAWFPDGSRVLFRAERGGDVALWSQAVDFSGPAELVQQSPRGNVWEGTVSRDSTLVYRTGTFGSANIYQRRLQGDTTSHPIATGSFTEWCGRASPDSRWVAYSADDSRLMQVYVRPLRRPGARVQISVDGGACPLWSRDGSRLFYVNNQQMLAAELRPAGNGLEVVRTRMLFEGDFIDLPGHANYDISPDDRYFLLVRPATSNDHAIVVHNWRAELRRRLRAARGVR